MGDGQGQGGTVIGEEKQMYRRAQLEIVLHTSKFQNILLHPWLHLKLSKLG